MRRSATEALLFRSRKLARRLDDEAGAEVLGIASQFDEVVRRQAALQERTLEGFPELAALGQASSGLADHVRPALEDIEKYCGLLLEEVKEIEHD